VHQVLDFFPTATAFFHDAERKCPSKPPHKHIEINQIQAQLLKYLLPTKEAETKILHPGFLYEKSKEKLCLQRLAA